MIGETVREILDCDLKLEQLGIPDLKAAILHAESVQDYVSRDLFRTILDDEEEHVDYLETQLDLIGRMGLEHFTHTQTEAKESGADDWSAGAPIGGRPSAGPRPAPHTGRE